MCRVDSTVPLVDVALAAQIFAPENADDAAQLRAMLAECVDDVLPRLAKVRALSATSPSPEAARELHQLRGVISNFGLGRAAERLKVVEKQWTELEARTRGELLDAAREEFDRGVEALRARFPFLNGSPA